MTLRFEAIMKTKRGVYLTERKLALTKGDNVAAVTEAVEKLGEAKQYLRDINSTAVQVEYICCC